MTSDSFSNACYVLTVSSMPMPKYVDHHARRQLVTEVAAEIVAARGVSRHSPCAASRPPPDSARPWSAITSPTNVTCCAPPSGPRRTDRTSRFEAAATAEQRSVVSCLEALLPLDVNSRRDWRLFVAFWGTAASDPELADEQRDRVRSARTRLEKVVAEQLPAGPSDARIARSLLTLVQGIATQAVFDPDDWTPRRQSEQLRTGVSALLPARAGSVAS